MGNEDCTITTCKQLHSHPPLTANLQQRLSAIISEHARTFLSQQANTGSWGNGTNHGQGSGGGAADAAAANGAAAAGSGTDGGAAPGAAAASNGGAGSSGAAGGGSGAAGAGASNGASSGGLGALSLGTLEDQQFVVFPSALKHVSRITRVLSMEQVGYRWVSVLIPLVKAHPCWVHHRTEGGPLGASGSTLHEEPLGGVRKGT